jgi:hypothetical protein
MSVVCQEADLEECNLIPINSSARKLLAAQKLVKVKFLCFMFLAAQVFGVTNSRVLPGPGNILITLPERQIVCLRILKMRR